MIPNAQTQSIIQRNEDAALWEQLNLENHIVECRSFLDTQAREPLWTCGFGSTRGVTDGMVWDRDETLLRFAADLEEIAWPRVEEWVARFHIYLGLEDWQRTAFVWDFAFNVTTKAWNGWFADCERIVDMKSAWHPYCAWIPIVWTGGNHGVQNRRWRMYRLATQGEIEERLW